MKPKWVLITNYQVYWLYREICAKVYILKNGWWGIDVCGRYIGSEPTEERAKKRGSRYLRNITRRAAARIGMEAVSK